MQETSRRPVIGILIGNSHTYHSEQIEKSILERLERENVDIRMYIGTESAGFLDAFSIRSDYDYQYLTLYGYTHFADLDAMIVSFGTITNYHNIPQEEFLSKLPDIPMVVIESDQQPKKGVFVISDNEKGIRDMVNHLIGMGRKKILFLGGPLGNRDAELREKSYRDTMKLHGFTVTENMVQRGDFTEYVDALAESLLSRNPDCDAIVSANDEMCKGIYRVLRKHSLTPGREIAVTGFDDTDTAAFMDPPLTTIRQNYHDVGYAAAEEVLHLIRGEAAENRFIPTRFIQRTSDGGLFTMDKANIAERQNMLIEKVRQFQRDQAHIWTGAILLRELATDSGSEQVFFEQLGQELVRLNIDSSYLYLLSPPQRVKQEEGIRLFDSLRLYLRQSGQNYDSYTKEEAPVVHYGEIRNYEFHHEKPVRMMSFLLFFSEEQYGIFEVSAHWDMVPFFYMLSIEIGTAIRYYLLSKEKNEMQRELSEKNELLSFTANHDNLTGLYNRLGVISHMKEYEKAHPGETMLAVMADLDHLKGINDTFGHTEGDNAIRVAADILRLSLGEGAVLGRTGGDEFMGITSTKYISGEILQDTVEKRCDTYNQTSGKPYYVEVSIGYYEYTVDDHEEVTAIFRKADDILYEDKKHRRSSSVKSDTPNQETIAHIRVHIKKKL